MEGSIHLKISTINAKPNDPLVITINSGTKEVSIKANTPDEKKKWVEALINSKDEAISGVNRISDLNRIIVDNHTLTQELRNFIVNHKNSKIDENIIQAKNIKNEFDSMLGMVNNFQNQINVKKITEINKYAEKLKNQTNIVLNQMEDENKNLLKMAKDLEKKAMKIGIYDDRKETEELHIEDVNNPEIEFQQDFSRFESFVGDDFVCYHSDNKVFPNKILQDFSEIKIKPNRKNSLNTIRETFQNNCPVKYRLLTENEAFLSTEIPEEEFRKDLPTKKDPNEKLNIWSLLKDAIGKDLTRFAVPVYLNEPLSMLQRFSEQLEYVEYLNEAAKHEDSCLRMAFVIGFAFSINSSTINRNKKPFNPMLGETFELVDTKKNFRFISEQVCHHPPISAGYADSPYWEFWSNTNLKTTFWGKSLEIKPLGESHVVIKQYKDHIIFTKNKSSVNNIIIGKMYIDHFGEMNFTNYNNGDTAVLHMKARGWNNKGVYEANGSIKDSQGNERYTLNGRWDKELFATEVATGKVLKVWERNPLPEDNEWQYYFTTFARQLNYLDKNTLSKCAYTDSRALEYGMRALAESEKLRLEDKQRAKRKENEKHKITHKAHWFEEKKSNETNNPEYVYLGGYWEAREKSYFEDLLDIY